MKPYFSRIALYSSILAFILWTVLHVFGSGAVHSAESRQSRINAIHLITFPSHYNEFEDLVMSYRDAGANTVIIRPVSREGRIDKQLLAKAVFLVHSAGLKLFVILPTRGISFLLGEHPEWEDIYYDLRSGTFQPSGKLDLFNPYVTVYLSDLFRDVAGYSVDGILLDDDFYYSDTEGMSKLAMERYTQKYGSSYPVRSALGKVKGDKPQYHRSEEYGEGFWNLAELKKNILLLVLKNIVDSSRAVNKQVKFWIPLHVPGLFLKEKELLAWYSHDMNAFKKIDLNFFWFAIPHRDIRAEQNIDYKKSIETVSRLVTSSTSLVDDPGKIIIGVQTTSLAGKILPLSEIEEVSMQMKKAGNTGIAFMVEPDTRLPSLLTKKIFGQNSNQ